MKRKLQKRERENYGARSKRLGNLATRTSVGISHMRNIMDKRSKTIAGKE